jgi:hypothetical protein
VWSADPTTEHTAFYSQHLKFLEASRIPNTADEVERPTRETTKWDPTRRKTAKSTSGSPSRRIFPVTGYCWPVITSGEEVSIQTVNYVSIFNAQCSSKIRPSSVNRTNYTDSLLPSVTRWRQQDPLPEHRSCEDTDITGKSQKSEKKFNIFTYFSKLPLNLHITVFPFLSFFLIPFFSPTFPARHFFLWMCTQNMPTYIRIMKFIPSVLVNYICMSSLGYSLDSTTCFGS